MVQSLNQSNLTSAHAHCILFRPLKFGWSTQVCARRPHSRRRFLRPACNSHPFRSDAWPLKASKVQLNLPGDRAKNQAGCWKEKSCYPLLVCSFRQALASCCQQNVTLITLHAQHNARTINLKTIYVVSSGVYLLIVGIKCIVHLGLQRPTVNAANESCGQTLPTILVLVISLLLFPSSPLKPNSLEYRNSFPAFLTSFDALSASEWIGI